MAQTREVRAEKRRREAKRRRERGKVAAGQGVLGLEVDDLGRHPWDRRLRGGGE